MCLVMSLKHCSNTVNNFTLIKFDVLLKYNKWSHFNCQFGSLIQVEVFEVSVCIFLFLQSLWSWLHLILFKHLHEHYTCTGSVMKVKLCSSGYIFCTESIMKVKLCSSGYIFCTESIMKVKLCSSGYIFCTESIMKVKLCSSGYIYVVLSQ